MKELSQPTKPSQSSQPPGSNLSLQALVGDILVYATGNRLLLVFGLKLCQLFWDNIRNK